MNIKKTLQKLDKMIADGKILEAFDKYFDTNVLTYDNHNQKTSSKQEKRDLLVAFFNEFKKSKKIKLHDSKVFDPVSFSKFTFVFEKPNGEVHEWHETIRRTWQNDLVIEEYYSSESFDKLTKQESKKKETKKSDKKIENSKNSETKNDSKKEVKNKESKEKVVKSKEKKGKEIKDKLPKAIVIKVEPVKAIEAKTATPKAIKAKTTTPKPDASKSAITKPKAAKSVVTKAKTTEPIVLANVKSKGTTSSPKPTAIKTAQVAKKTEVAKPKKTSNEAITPKTPAIVKPKVSIVKPKVSNVKPKAEKAVAVIKTTKEAAPIKKIAPKTILAKADNLTLIEGIGPKIASILKSNNISDFAELSKAPVATLNKILDAAGGTYKSHNPSTWPMQAKLAAAGKIDELNELKKKIVSGVLQK